ncbi:MAG TPA: hypothetical protein VFC42_04285 [Methylomirabilota bacterium]|nr:hypothetical protein [Methylomirabilota bacterium]
MRARGLMVLVLAAAVVAGCAGNELKARKDAAWSHVPQALPDGPHVVDSALPRLSTLPDPTWSQDDPLPSGYGHPFRALGFALHPIGVALDYALVRPFYMLAGLAPEWFGLTADDAHRYQSHMPELIISREAPRRFE